MYLRTPPEPAFLDIAPEGISSFSRHRWPFHRDRTQRLSRSDPFQKPSLTDDPSHLNARVGDPGQRLLTLVCCSAYAEAARRSGIISKESEEVVVVPDFLRRGSVWMVMVGLGLFAVRAGFAREENLDGNCRVSLNYCLQTGSCFWR